MENREFYLLNETTEETFLIRSNDLFVQVISSSLDVNYYDKVTLDAMLKSPELLLIEL